MTIENETINALRVLSVDAVENAHSGHPGMALGSAPAMYALWANHLRFDSSDDQWINRDRFVLSAGHVSPLLYSLLHLFGYKVTLDDLKSFRRFNSCTPGHPEYGHTSGVEATTGPLGAGLSTAVGMAMAQEHLAHRFNRPGFNVFDNYTFVLCGDGCMMEGITAESSSIAGTLSLGRLIILYDSNNITIEGNTELTFKEDICKRYEAYGFETYTVDDGNNLEELNTALESAKKHTDKPSFIKICTTIGYGSPKAGSASVHGAPLGQEGVLSLKKFLKYSSMEPFYVAPEVYDHCEAISKKGAHQHKIWLEMMERYQVRYPELDLELERMLEPIQLEKLLSDASLFEFDRKPQSTRNISGLMINRLKNKYRGLIGGSADLSPSNMTMMDGETSFNAENYAGRNIHFGIREHAMAAIGNGLYLYGGLKPYVATFFVFSDFLKPMARLSALMQTPLIYVFTHDSIGVGEDGPTHEPIEQLTMFRSLPNFNTFRPADAVETAYGWILALSSKTTPTGLILSRQNLPQLEQTGSGALRGGYIVYGSQNEDVILVSSGSEVSLAIEAAKLLTKHNILARVVSMPCIELFEEQSNDYRESILPNQSRKRVVIEAAASLSWGKIGGIDGLYLCLDQFGASGTGPTLFKAFGFSPENIAVQIRNYMDQ